MLILNLIHKIAADSNKAAATLLTIKLIKITAIQLNQKQKNIWKLITLIRPSLILFHILWKISFHTEQRDVVVK